MASYLTPEHRQRISESMSGKRLSRSHKNAISAGASGWSDEARRRSKATRMHQAEVKRKLKARLKQIDAEMVKDQQRIEVKSLTNITSPYVRMMWDRKYLTAGAMSPQDLYRLWMVTAKQHGMWHGKVKQKFQITAKGMAAFVKLRAWLSDLGIYPERYLRAVFNSASYNRSRGGTWRPFVSSATSNHYFKVYVEWEKRLVAYDEGWIELMKDVGVQRLPKKIQDGMIESAEGLCDIVEAVQGTYDLMIDRYFAELSPYLLFFMPAAQPYIAAQRGTREQQMVFRSLARDAKLRARFQPFYDAAVKYFKITDLTMERRQMAKEKIERMLREQQEAAARAAGLKLDDPLQLAR